MLNEYGSFTIAIIIVSYPDYLSSSHCSLERESLIFMHKRKAELFRLHSQTAEVSEVWDRHLLTSHSHINQLPHIYWDLLLRCLVNDTLRGMVCTANGEEFTGPYLAIEAGMMQKLLVDGLHLDRKIAAAFFRDYLTPPETNCFDLYGGGPGGPIQHYLDYPITQNNRERYKKWSK